MMRAIKGKLRRASRRSVFAPSRPRQRSCCGRLRFPDQLRRPPRPSRSDPLCTNIQPGPPKGGRPPSYANLCLVGGRAALPNGSIGCPHHQSLRQASERHGARSLAPLRGWHISSGEQDANAGGSLRSNSGYNRLLRWTNGLATARFFGERGPEDNVERVYETIRNSLPGGKPARRKPVPSVRVADRRRLSEPRWRRARNRERTFSALNSVPLAHLEGTVGVCRSGRHSLSSARDAAGASS
jgi:hypothetical protein